MAEFGILIAEKLMEVIGSEVIKEVCDMWNYKSQLDELKETVSTIHKVLLDADARRELSNVDQDYIDKLKDAVYDADDLFDEFLTLAELKQLRPLNKRGKIYEKVRCFFSSKNQLGQAYRMSRDVKHIKKRLGDIADCHKKFGFSVDYKPIIRRREETCSYVDANKIIGREEDKEAIVKMLLDRNNEEVCFTTIVGVGGLGKTTLAQLVYDDERVNKEFHQNMKFWVCVSDQEGEQFDVKTILINILEQVTGKKIDDDSTLQLVQHQFQEELRGQKYFLVLDDVWNEDPKKWRNLQDFLMLGQGGSRVMVTTRSMFTAKIIGERHVHKLEGLSGENSWCLFEMSAFDKEIKRENRDEYVEIGKKIVGKCHSNPLALKVVGSLLFGQSISKWHLVEDSELGKIEKGDNEIMSTLKLSYHNLPPSLKSCFSYCAIFPKDYRLEKRMLLDLWVAHGYILSSLDGNESLEDVAEEHFAILLRRCFFQDVIKTKYDSVDSVKIHDLMHDVAQDVGKEEIRVVTCIPNTLGYKIRHVHYVGQTCLKSTLGSDNMRSFICRGDGKSVVDVHTQIENQMRLRVLELSELDVVKLPNSIGKLQHLRYLGLSCNTNLELLPNAITRLHNLQTLLLKSCENLRELPKDFCKLVKLRHLDLSLCDKLICMPSGMEKLTNLEVLPHFVVGKRFSIDEGFEALKSFTRLRGKICIEIGEKYREVEGLNGNKGGYLKNMNHLNKVKIIFYGDKSDNLEAVLESLEPPPNLKWLRIIFYEGRRIPKWGRAKNNWATSLSRLVNIRLEGCENLEEMPVLSELPLLEKLGLGYLCKLEYMEEITSNESDIQSTKLFFPSLVNLEIIKLKKLKGWWKEESSSSLNGIGDDNCCCLNRRSKFPCLSKLVIVGCYNLTSFPSCPTIEELEFRKNNKRLEIHVDIDDDATGNSQGDSRLKRLEVDSMSCLKSLRLQHLTALEYLTLGSHFKDNVDMVLEDEFQACPFLENLRSLEFKRLQKMTSLPKGMQYLTSLQDLTLWWCDNLKTIPEWIGCLSSLESLYIDCCPALVSLPQAVFKLTSLQNLAMNCCPQLQKRYKESTGEDRPKIHHHISHLKP